MSTCTLYPDLKDITSLCEMMKKPVQPLMQQLQLLTDGDNNSPYRSLSCTLDVELNDYHYDCVVKVTNIIGKTDLGLIIGVRMANCGHALRVSYREHIAQEFTNYLGFKLDLFIRGIDTGHITNEDDYEQVHILF